MEHYFWAHTIDTGGIHMAVRRAGNADMRAMQLFTAIPKYYGDKVSIRPERVARFHEALAATKIAPERIVVHAAYVLNVATPDETKWSRARDGLAKEPWKLAERQAFRYRLPPGARLLEIGAGTGQDSVYFQEQGCAVVAGDLSPVMVEHCRADEQLLGFATAQFAVVDFHTVDVGHGHRFQSLTLRRPDAGGRLAPAPPGPGGR